MNNVNCKSQAEIQLNVDSIRLKDIIDIDLLQCLQDNFSKGVGLASITVDLDGIPVTRPSNYTRFCMDYTHSTACGDKRCAESHRIGGEEAACIGKPFVYECHAGLIDFAAPIILEGRQIGTILGGQVLTDTPDEFKYRKIAREVGVDEDEYVKAVREVYQLSKDRVESAANVLYIMANYMSKTAYYQRISKEESNLLSNGLNQISTSVQELAGSAHIAQLSNTGMNSSVSAITNSFHEVINLINNIEHNLLVQQKEMARLDRLNLIGEMAASIGHEVRNPLTTVRGFLQFFSKKNEFKNYVTIFDIMIEELDRANEIITDFLSLAKNRKLDFKMMDLNEIIKKSTPLLQTDALLKNIPIETSLANISLLLLDEKEIKQLILNLIRNAIEATEKDEVVEIATFMDDKKTVLQITDKGCGIPQDILERLGTPFLSTKAAGTGLGLAVCYRIADRHSASIVIDSHEGIGTRVRVIFK